MEPISTGASVVTLALTGLMASLATGLAQAQQAVNDLPGGPAVRQLDLRDAITAVYQAQQSGDLQGLITRHTLAEQRGHVSTGSYRRSIGRSEQ